MLSNLLSKILSTKLWRTKLRPIFTGNPGVFKFMYKILSKITFATPKNTTHFRATIEELAKSGEFAPTVSYAHGGGGGYYVVAPSMGGLLSVVLKIVSECAFAVNEGLTPVVDMKNNVSCLQPEDKLGMVNAWELLFEQPCGIKIEDIPSDANITHNDVNQFPTNLFNCSDNNVFAFYSSIFSKFFKLSDTTELFINKTYNRLLKGKRVLGVQVRGTDYRRMRLAGHPIQATPEEILEITKLKFEQWNCELIFVGTDEYAVIELFERHFPGKILHCQKYYYDSYNNNKSVTLLSDIKLGIENEHYEKNLEYLTSQVLLSRCNCLIGCKNSGLMFSYYLNNGKYDSVEIIDKGID